MVVSSTAFGAQLGREGVFWISTIVLIAFVIQVERRPLRSIGLQSFRWISILIGVGGAAIMVAGMAVIYLAVFPALSLSDTGQTTAILSTPLWFRIALITRAAIFEEIFFRGFMIERIGEMMGSKWIAAGLSLAAFTFAHLGGWGWAHLIVAGFGGLVLTGLYLWRRDLLTNMIAHFLTDAIGFLVG